MSLPSTRDYFFLNDPTYKRNWAENIKNMIVSLAVMSQQRENYEILIAWNGAVCRPNPQKRADILDPGNTTMVCTYIPLQYLQEYKIKLLYQVDIGICSLPQSTSSTATSFSSTATAFSSAVTVFSSTGASLPIALPLTSSSTATSPSSTSAASSAFSTSTISRGSISPATNVVCSQNYSKSYRGKVTLISLADIWLASGHFFKSVPKRS